MTVRQLGGQFATVVEALRAAADAIPEVEAYVELAGPGSSELVADGSDGRRRMTFAQWDEAADQVATGFAALGVTKGDVVCLLVPSSIDYALCYQAAARLGAVTTGVNLRLGASELDSIVSRVRPVLTVVDTAVAAEGVYRAGGGRVVPRHSLGAMGSGRRVAHVELAPDDPVAIVWTSASTGSPKGAVFAHRNLKAVAAGTDVLSQPGDRRLSPLPFAHVGYMTRAWDEIEHGITTVVTPQPWTAGVAVELMQTERVTVGQGVPTQWALVLAHPALEPARLGHLRVAATGAARVPPELVRAMRDRLGCTVVVRYTSTETSLGTGTDPSDPDEVVATTVGRPVPGVDLELADDEGRPVPAGEVGRVRIRSDAAMLGYVADQPRHHLVDVAATASVKDASGWVTTGDLGWLGEDGNLRLVGRVSEMYIRGGYNVFPAEVEAALGAHPAVAQVAVVGVPDPVLGEIGAAFVVVRPDGPPPDLEGLRETTRRQLADYKAPDRAYLVDELPVTAIGKVDKRALAAQASDLERRAEPGRKLTKVEVNR